METTNEKFLNYSDGEMNELESFISDYVTGLKIELYPALELLNIERVNKFSRKFLLEKRASYLLDQAAIERGFKSAAHEAFTIAKEKENALAEEQAKRDAIAKAEKEQQEKLIAEQLLQEKILREEREKKDAENAALAKAKQEALYHGEMAVNSSPVI